MKKLILLFLAVVTITANAQTRSELELIKDIFKVEKKAVVGDFMKLTDEQASKFWPIYPHIKFVYLLEKKAKGCPPVETNDQDKETQRNR